MPAAWLIASQPHSSPPQPTQPTERRHRGHHAPKQLIWHIIFACSMPLPTVLFPRRVAWCALVCPRLAKPLSSGFQEIIRVWLSGTGAVLADQLVATDIPRYLAARHA